MSCMTLKITPAYLPAEIALAPQVPSLNVEHDCKPMKPVELPRSYYIYLEGQEQGDMDMSDFYGQLASEIQGASSEDYNYGNTLAKGEKFAGKTIEFTWPSGGGDLYRNYLWLVWPKGEGFTSATVVGTGLSFALEPTVEFDKDGARWEARRSNAMLPGASMTVQFA